MDSDMRTLVITGASRGIGAHLAHRAVEQGFRVVGLARNTSQEISAYELRRCDVADAQAVQKSLEDLRRDDSLYGLINTAGIASMNLAVMTPPETIQRIISTNLIGTINCSSIVGKWLTKQKRGRIVNFSTIAVPLGLKGESVYVASKAGVEGFTRSFAREMADFNITVNAVAPGPIETNLIAKVPPEKIAAIVERQIIQRMAEPEDIWKVVSMLLGPDAHMITGQIINIGGV